MDSLSGIGMFTEVNGPPGGEITRPFLPIASVFPASANHYQSIFTLAGHNRHGD